MMTIEHHPVRRRVRRCSWQMGTRCHEAATKRVRVTYLGAPVDRHPLMCDAHADRAEELVRPGWAIAAVEPLEGTTPE